MTFSHIPVMLSQVVEGLAISPGGSYIDGTTGGGGHSFEIARRLTDGGILLCGDRDEDALKAASLRLAPYRDRVRLIHSNFSEIEDYAARWLPDGRADGILLDLGVSSYQLDTPERGFSYQIEKDAPLDMRMDRTQGLTARDVVNGYSREQLTTMIREWGEERFAGRVAGVICAAREKKPIETTGQLSALIASAVPPDRSGGNPARRTFQAIRIAVNGELDVIDPTIRAAVRLLRPGGRLVIITFHSLEDRAVKNAFAALAKGCTCPSDFPVCVCGKRPQIRLITRKPMLPTEEECRENARAHSAKLRIAEKLDD